MSEQLNKLCVNIAQDFDTAQQGLGRANLGIHDQGHGNWLVPDRPHPGNNLLLTTDAYGTMQWAPQAEAGGIKPSQLSSYILAGSNITITPGSSSITISSTGGGGVSYSAGAGVDITNNIISADFVSQPPAGAHSSGTFPQVSDGTYSITQNDLTNGWINLRLADIRPADAVTAGSGVSFQVFLNGLHWTRLDPQTQVTTGDSFRGAVYWSIADKTAPNSWSSSTYITDVDWSWGNQTITDQKAIAFADISGSADFVDTFPQLSIFLPTELRNVIAVGDTLHLEGFVYAIPAKYRLSLV